MEQGGISKDKLQHLFENLEVLRRLSEECIASSADSNTCHHYSDAQTAETAPSSNHRQTTFVTDETSQACVRTTEHESGVATSTAPSSDRRQTTTVTVPSSGDGFSIQTSPVTSALSDARIRSNALVATAAVPSSNHRQTTSVTVPSSGDGFSIQTSPVTNALSDARIQSDAHVATHASPVDMHCQHRQSITYESLSGGA